MARTLQFADSTPIIIEVSSDDPAFGVNAVDTGLSAIPAKIAATFQESLHVIGAVGNAVRNSIAAAGVESAEVKIGFKASGTGQFIIAQSTIEGAIEVTFKVKIAR